MRLFRACFTAIAFFLLSLIVQTFSELVVLHHRYSKDSPNDLTCISEDQNGAALIWNYNVTKPPKNIEGLTPWRNDSGKLVDCSVRNVTKCLTGWDPTTDWQVKNSSRKSMGPVFDHRWEDLREFGFKGQDKLQEYQKVGMVKKSAGRIWFSARGKQDVQIHMCKGKDPTTDGPCIYVMIASWQGKRSVIKSCPKGLPKPGFNRENCYYISIKVEVQQFHATSIEPKSWVSCSTISCLISSMTLDSIAHKPKTVMDPYDWRTFKIEWGSDEEFITVFKKSEPSEPFLTGKRKNVSWLKELPKELWVSVRGHESARVRFHLYDYYYTKTKNAVITTKRFAHSGKAFRAELMVSLCEKCKLNIELLDRDNRIERWEASAKERSFYENLLSWQLVTLTTTLDDDNPRDLRFKIESILDGYEDKCRWAIDTFRIYESGDEMRRLDLSLNEKRETATCQELTYAGTGETVDSGFWRLDSNEAKSQLLEFIHEHKEQDIGKNEFMCNPNGCTCGNGFAGFRCNADCDPGRYGHNCAQYCGSCQELKKCDKETGFCQGKCRDHKIAPFCEKDLEAPTFENIGDETVTVIQKIDLGAEQVKSVEIYLEEQPKKENAETRVPITDQKRLGNTLILECNITGLKHGTVYAVYTVVLATSGDQSPSDSPRGKFATTCNGKTKFEVEPADRSLTVRSWNEDCPIETYAEEDYEVIVTSTSKNDVEKRAPFGSVPFTMSGLTPATNYAVKIKDKKVDHEWDLPDIRTLDSAPSKVVGLEAKSTNTTVTIRWNPPSDPGGDIKNYGVTIVLRVRRGCEDFGEETLHEDAKECNVTTTTKTFENLHPYANYVVNVWAYNSMKGIPEEKSIDTESNTLPASKVRNLRYNKTSNFVEWDYPECTTVTGPAKVHSMLMKHKNDTKWNTDWWRRREAQLDYNLFEFGLDPFEEYTVRVYVVRSYDNLKTNESAYAQINFTSKPAAPPAVRNLTMYNTDPVNNTVSLRWLAPEPANGELKGYVISVKDQYGQNYSKITTNGREDVDCNYQEDFLCYENLGLPQVAENNDLRVEVFAQNKDVEEFGKTRTLPIRREIFEQAPNKPRNLKVYKTQIPGVVKLEWKHPWYSPTKISSYSIRATFVRTYLLEKTVSQKPNEQTLHVTYPDQGIYTKELSLLPSTVYIVSIAAINRRDISSGEVFHPGFRVEDSIGFDGEPELCQESESSIEVKVPRILNVTENTWVSVNVKGMRTCDYDHSQKPSPEDRPSWDAKEYKVDNIREEIFFVSANRYSDQSSNCSLCIGETYTVSIHVMDRNASFGSSRQISSDITLINEIPQKSSLVWLVVVPILATFVLILFVVKYRKRDKCPLIDSARTASDASIPWELKETPVPEPRPTPTPDVIPCSPLSNPVSIEDFEEYTKDGLKSGLLSSQYEEFPKGLTKPCDYGRLPENASKNRWVNLIAYDETRVVLKTLEEDPYSDYINASYIPGYQNERAYIATQGPKPETVNDFWRMIWQEKVCVICMLANVMEHGRTKCAQYWPEIGDEIQHGGILVSNMAQVVYINYTIRTFGLTFKKKRREITHLHYTGWPDHGVPMFTQSIVPYLKKLQSVATGDEPIVVHCSAGVGRTGTIILCDSSLRQAKSEMMVDLAAMTGRMREYRARMVDNEQQYVFAHLAIVEYMLSEQTEIPCNVYSTGRINEARKLLISHIKRVRNIMWGERVMESIGEPTSSLPDDVVQDEIAELNLADPSMGLFGPIIMRSDVNRNHVQTVSIDGFKIENQFLMTWLPSPSTRSKVWELIADDNIELVIVLQTPDEKDPTSCDLMPSQSNPISSRSLQVEFKGCLEEDEDCKIDKVSVTKTSEISEDPQFVTVITCQGWGRGLDGRPPAVGALVSLWMASEKVSRSESPTLVLCHDGVMGCGMYVALSFLLERIAVEKECDVISAVRRVRRSKPEFGQSIEQFEYLYDAALNYVDRFKLYSNYS